LVITELCGSPELQECRFDEIDGGSIVPIRQAGTPIRLRHSFGFDLSIFCPCYRMTQMVTQRGEYLRIIGAFSTFFTPLLTVYNSWGLLPSRECFQLGGGVANWCYECIPYVSQLAYIDT